MVVFTYLVTKDLVETLENKVGYKLSMESKSELKKIEVEFLNKFWEFIPKDKRKCSLEASDVSRKIECYLERRKREYTVVSLDRIYCKNADEYLEVTRLTSPFSGKVCIAERPGKEKLYHQIKRLKNYSKIILSDVGAFEGKTIINLCELFEKEKIDIAEVCLGIVREEAEIKIRARYNLKSVYKINFYEWVELRDLIGIDGRNAGLRNGKRLIIPYWENSIKWASIPENKESNFQELSKEFNSRVIWRLWQEGYDLSYIATPIKYYGGKK